MLTQKQNFCFGDALRRQLKDRRMASASMNDANSVCAFLQSRAFQRFTSSRLSAPIEYSTKYVHADLSRSLRQRTDCRSFAAISAGLRHPRDSKSGGDDRSVVMRRAFKIWRWPPAQIFRRRMKTSRGSAIPSTAHPGGGASSVRAIAIS